MEEWTESAHLNSASCLAALGLTRLKGPESTFMMTFARSLVRFEDGDGYGSSYCRRSGFLARPPSLAWRVVQCPAVLLHARCPLVFLMDTPPSYPLNLFPHITNTCFYSDILPIRYLRMMEKAQNWLGHRTSTHPPTQLWQRHLLLLIEISFKLVEA